MHLFCFMYDIVRIIELVPCKKKKEYIDLKLTYT